MDKYELVLEIIEHPENFTSDELTEILSDAETREIYNLLCKTDAAMVAGKEIDVDAEWNEFSRGRVIDAPRRFFTWTMGRAATIAVIVCTSIVAVAAGIAITVAVGHRQVEYSRDLDSAESRQLLAEYCDTVTATIDEITDQEGPIQFEDEPLEMIMKSVATVYKVEVIFNSRDVAGLHLYYKFDPSLTLDEILSQLNTFEQINIIRNGDTLTVD